MIATVTTEPGRPAEANRSVAGVPSSRKCSAGAMVEIIIGASVWPVQLGHDRSDGAEGLLQPRSGH